MKKQSFGKANGMSGFGAAFKGGKEVDTTVKGSNCRKGTTAPSGAYRMGSYKGK